MKCPLCSTKATRTKGIETQERGNPQKKKVYVCDNCGLFFLEDYKKSRLHIYNETYAPWGKSTKAIEQEISRTKQETFRMQLKRLGTYTNRDPVKKKLLDLGTGRGYLLDVAREMGFDCWGVEWEKNAAKAARRKFGKKIMCGTIFDTAFPSGFFDVVAMIDFLEHIPDPTATMKEVNRILQGGGVVYIITPDTDSWTRRLLGKRWFQYKDEHILYFNQKSLTKLAQQTRFTMVAHWRNTKKFSLGYYEQYFKKYAPLPAGKLVQRIMGMIPQRMKRWGITNAGIGEIAAILKKKE